MAIRVGYEDVGALGRLAAIAGETKRAEREQDILQRVISQARAQKHAKEMAQFSADLELARAKRDRLWEMEDEEVAHQWQLEKMMLVSRIDFMEEERKRIKNKQEYEAGVKIIEESNLPDTGPYSKESALFDLRMKKEVGFIPAREREAQPRIPTVSIIEGLQVLGYSDEEIKDILNLSGTTPIPERTALGQRTPSVEEAARQVMGEQPSQTQIKYQRNPATGQVRMSNDGGRTWQIIG